MLVKDKSTPGTHLGFIGQELQNRTGCEISTSIAGSNKSNRTREQRAMRLGAEGGRAVGEGRGH